MPAFAGMTILAFVLPMCFNENHPMCFNENVVLANARTFLARGTERQVAPMGQRPLLRSPPVQGSGFKG